MEPGRLQPRHDRLPAPRRARDAAVHGVPRRRRVQGQVHRLRLVPPDAVQRHDEPEPRRQRLPDDLRDLPQGLRYLVGPGHLQPQRHGVPAGWVSTPRSRAPPATPTACSRASPPRASRATSPTTTERPTRTTRPPGSRRPARPATRCPTPRGPKARSTTRGSRRRHGNSGGVCATCHTNPTNYVVFSCTTGCHPEEPDRQRSPGPCRLHLRLAGLLLLPPERDRAIDRRDGDPHEVSPPPTGGPDGRRGSRCWRRHRRPRRRRGGARSRCSARARRQHQDTGYSSSTSDVIAYLTLRSPGNDDGGFEYAPRRPQRQVLRRVRPEPGLHLRRVLRLPEQERVRAPARPDVAQRPRRPRLVRRRAARVPGQAPVRARPPPARSVRRRRARPVQGRRTRKGCARPAGTSPSTAISGAATCWAS